MKKILYALSSALLLAAGVAQPLAAAPQSGPTDGRTLEFIPNKGQWPSQVRYAGAVPGGHLYLEPTGLRYMLLQPIKHPHLHGASSAPARQPTPSASQRRAVALPHLPAADSLVHGHQLRVRFVGADATTPLAPAEATGEARNYLHGNDPTHWAKAVPSYRQVRYQAPWPGIGARFYENSRQQLEYDFELAAGANPHLVKLKYEGATQLTLGSDGRLHVGTSVGELTELAPQAYQTDPTTGQHQAVACQYQLHPADSTVTFELGRYDHGRPLVIDPTVIFSTYSGARGDNWGFTAAYDAAGNLYSGGIVLDDGLMPSYPTTAGAFQTRFGGIIDIALIKYNTTVTGPAARVWATYLGGNAEDFPSSLVVNSQNELLVLGATASTNYPTTSNAAQRAFGRGVVADPFGLGYFVDPFFFVKNGSDIVVTRLSADGGTLAASTYLGGQGNDGLVAYQPGSTVRQLSQNYGDAFRGDIQLDAQGNVYIASTTSSTNFPTTAGSFGPTSRGGACDAVVVKLPPTLGTPIWSGYLGGSAADAAYSLKLDAGGNVYVTGGTLSTNFPGTAGGLFASAQGSVDGFVARIAANGSSVQKATYLGTSSYDQTFFVQLGADGGVYLLGQTLGTWPVSAGVYSNAGSRQFIQKLSADLDRSLISMVFGSKRSTLDIVPTAFLVDQCDRVYACGWGGMVNKDSPYSFNNGYTDGMPTTANAVRSTPDTPGAGSDFYLAQFAPGLTELTYGTFYGDAGFGSEGDHVDGGTSRFDPRGIVYAAVCSCFNNAGFPVPPGANTYATVSGSGSAGFCNNAAFKLNFEPTVATVGLDQPVCATGPPIKLVGTPTGGTWTGPGVTGSVATGFIFTPTPALAGRQLLTYTAPAVSTACQATATQTITVQAAPRVTTPTLPTVCAGSGAVPLTAGQPSGGVWTGPGVSASGPDAYVFTPSLALVGTQTLTYTIASSLGCGGQATTTIQVLTAPALQMAADTVLCPGSSQPIQLRALPAGGTWSGPGVTASGLFTPPSTPGTVAALYTVGAGTPCPVSAVRRITLLAAPTLAPAVAPLSCRADSITAPPVAPYTLRFSQPATTLLADAVLTWDFGDGSAPATGLSVLHTYTTPGSFQPKATLRFNGSRCAVLITLAPIQVQSMLIPNVFTPNGDKQNDFFAPRIGGCQPHLQVFSRWGQLVYESAVYLNNWDGAGLAAGLYYFLLSPPDGSTPVKGWVELIR